MAKDLERNIDDGCENAKQVASRYGYHIVCDDDDAVETENTQSTDDGCENAKQVASRFGVHVVCDD